MKGNLKIVQRCIICANKLNGINQTGDKNHQFDSNISDEQREYNREHRKQSNPGWEGFRKKIFERDNYKCVITGKTGKLNCHHLDGWHWCKEKRFDSNNCVTLCEEIHGKFHKIYGQKDDTRKQFEDFKLNY